MSGFDKHWDKYCISSNCDESEARGHFEAGIKFIARSNAPEGTTHFDEKWGKIFYYKLGVSLKIWNGKEFVYFDHIYNLSMYDLNEIKEDI